MAMRRFSIATLGVLVLHATSLFFLILFLATPKNKYEWMNDMSLQPMELPLDSDAGIRTAILFIATVAPAVVAVLCSRSALGPHGRLVSWIFGCAVVAVSLAKILM